MAKTLGVIELISDSDIDSDWQALIPSANTRDHADEPSDSCVSADLDALKSDLEQLLQSLLHPQQIH